MAATEAEINAYITNIRSAVADYGDELATKQMVGTTDIHCNRVKLMLLSAYLDCVCDYFLETDYANNNFFTTSEIRDVMQHINNICKTNYILVNL